MKSIIVISSILCAIPLSFSCMAAEVHPDVPEAVDLPARKEGIRCSQRDWDEVRNQLALFLSQQQEMEDAQRATIADLIPGSREDEELQLEIAIAESKESYEEELQKTTEDLQLEIALAESQQSHEEAQHKADAEESADDSIARRSSLEELEEKRRLHVLEYKLGAEKRESFRIKAKEYGVEEGLAFVKQRRKERRIKERFGFILQLIHARKKKASFRANARRNSFEERFAFMEQQRLPTAERLKSCLKQKGITLEKTVSFNDKGVGTGLFD